MPGEPRSVSTCTGPTGDDGLGGPRTYRSRTGHSFILCSDDSYPTICAAGWLDGGGVFLRRSVTRTWCTAPTPGSKEVGDAG